MRWRWVVMAGLVVLGAEALAEESDPNAGPAAAEPDAVHTGREILVQDQQLRSVEIFSETAIETEVITEQEIRELPATNAVDVLSNLPGIRVQRRIQGEEAAVSIEGMPVTYTRILVNGQRYSGRVGGVDDLRDIPIENVERIEILRGSQGVRFGTGAGGGVVNIITQSAPEEGYSISYEGGGGTHDKVYTATTPAARFGDFGLTLRGVYDRIGGFDPRGGVNTQAGGEDSERVARDVFSTFDYPVNEDFLLRGQAGWRREDEKFVPVDSEDSLVPPDAIRRKYSRWTGNAGFDWTVNESTNAVFDFNYFFGDTESGVGRSFELLEDEFQIDASLDHYLETGPIEHILVGGFDVVIPRIDLREGELPPNIENPELEMGRTVQEMFVESSLYMQTESALTDWLSLILGLRARFHTDYDSRVLPQVGVLVQPLRGLKLRGSWGLNYRTPSLAELYQPPTPQLGGLYFLGGNPDLQPEESMSARGGLEWSPRPWLSFSATGYFNDIQDNIRSVLDGSLQTGTQLLDFDLNPDDFPPELLSICEAQRMFFDPSEWTPECSGEPFELPISANLYRRENLDSVQTWGAELQLRFRFREWVRGTLGYTYLKTRVVDSNILVDELPNSPEHTFDFRIFFTAPVTETRLVTNGRFRSEALVERSGTGLLSFTDSTTRSEPSFELDLRLAQPVFDWLEVYFDVRNVTDERTVDSYAIRGRTYFAGVKGNFAWQPGSSLF